MSLSREQELLLRRERLLARSAQLRGEIASQARAFGPRFAWADRAAEGWRWVKAHPEWAVGATATLLVLRPRRLVRWGTRLLGLWQFWRRTQPVWAALAARMR